MELTAALHALQRCAGEHGEADTNFMTACGDYTQVTLHTDSTYVHDGLTKFLTRRIAK
jgi:ribonuclease HI